MILLYEDGPTVNTGTVNFTLRENGVLKSSWSYGRQTYYHHVKALGDETRSFYKKRREGHLLPLLPYFNGETTMDSPNTGSYSASKTAGGVTSVVSSSNWGWVNASVTDVIPTDLGAAFTKWHDAYNGGYHLQEAAADIYSSGWDVLTFVGELRETIAMFCNLFRRFLKLYKKQPTGDSPEGVWLEWRYGWRTLILDMKKFVQTVNEFDSEKSRYREVSRGSYSSNVDSVFYGADQQLALTGTWHVAYTASVRGTVVADIFPPKFAVNPLVTGWELIKLSFVVDWFLSVGNALAALSFMMLRSSHVSAVGLELKIDRTLSISASGINGWTGTVSHNPVGKAIFKARWPAMVPLIPQLHCSLNVEKVIDLLALLRQFTRR